jgi:hypothetical protein
MKIKLAIIITEGRTGSDFRQSLIDGYSDFILKNYKEG